MNTLVAAHTLRSHSIFSVTLPEFTSFFITFYVFNYNPIGYFLYRYITQRPIVYMYAIKSINSSVVACKEEPTHIQI